MIRKVITALILVPLAIIFVFFAVANRQEVVVSFDPLLDYAHPAFSRPLPLYMLILILIIGGVILGGAAAWLRQGKWRSRARRLEAELRWLRAEYERLASRTGAPGRPASSLPATEPPRLTIPPPA